MLASPEQNCLFILYYLKVSPTFDVLVVIFGRMPNPVNRGANYHATINFAGQYKLAAMDQAFLSSPANYGPTGAMVSISITRP